MTETSEPSDTDLWRQAIEVCESLSGLSRNQAITKLKAMELAPALLNKIQWRTCRPVIHCWINMIIKV